MGIDFYILPEELAKWLAERVASDKLWCIPRYWGGGKCGNAIANESEIIECFHDPDIMWFYIGKKQIAVPRFKKNGDLDMIESMCMILGPSIIKNKVLKGAGLMMHSTSRLLAAGKDPTELRKLYNRLGRSIKKLMSKKYTVAAKLDDGRIIPYKEIHITEAAANWHKAGGFLGVGPEECKDCRWILIPRKEVTK